MKAVKPITPKPPLTRNPWTWHGTGKGTPSRLPQWLDVLVSFGVCVFLILVCIGVMALIVGSLG